MPEENSESGTSVSNGGRPLSEGAILFGDIVRLSRPRTIAETLKCDESAVRLWVKRRRSPSPKWRRKIEAIYGVPEESWGEDTKRTAHTRKPMKNGRRVRTAKLNGETSVELLENVIETLRSLKREAEYPDSRASVRDRTQIASSLTQAITRLAKLRREDILDDAAIVASPFWQRFCAALPVAMTPWPPASQAADELVRLWSTPKKTETEDPEPFHPESLSTEDLQTLHALLGKARHAPPDAQSGAQPDREDA